VRESLASVLNLAKDIQIVGTSNSFASTMDVLGSNAVDVLIMDVRLEGESGLQIARSVIEKFSSIKIVMLTSFMSDDVLVDAYSIGVSAFLLKSGSADTLLEAIRDVNAGIRLMDREKVRAASRALNESGLGEIRALDETDKKIAYYISLGHSDKQISESVFLSIQTVRNRVSRLLTRFDKDNRTQLALLFSEVQEELHA
jgi:NarL family two-component system response regulator LiaR